MTNPSASPDPAASAGAAADPPRAGAGRREDSFLVFLLKLVLLVAVFRSFVFSPFNIPSESMLPRLVNGDYLLAAKWPYGFSRQSLPFAVPLLPEERLLASAPERGDVVIFKQPPLKELDYIKRVIGLPGDTVQMIDGQLFLNGAPVPKQRLSDAELAVSPNTACYSPQFAAKRADGADVCRYPRYRETLPGGRSYEVIDLGQRAYDTTEPVIVPEGQLFLMGDNRDNSEDSRFPAEPGRGIGLVPMDNLVGRASIVMWSTDGSAEWLKPWTWFSAARWNRIGGTF
jgi:signal peptidase I